MCTIPDFYVGQKLLVTGATGFMGKVLIEKLLRACPDLDSIYILVRDKRGKTPEERWFDITQQLVFERVKKEKPLALNKIKVVRGDTQCKDLGLTDKDKQELIDNVTLIFHVAANVLFFENLYRTIIINTRGTLGMAELAKSMKHLKCFLHVSTTFSNVDRYSEVHEKIYEPVQDWRHILKVAEEMDEYSFCCLTGKILADHPNAYTLSKSMAEKIMEEYSSYFPVVILRPSVVINAFKEPVEGWLDNLHGPSVAGMVISSGILRVQFVNRDAFIDYVAVDYAVNGFISAAWDMSIRQEKTGLEVYNCRFGEQFRTTGAQYKLYGLEYTELDPMEDMLWYPFLILTNSDFWHPILFFFLQIIPAALADGVLWLLRKELRLWKITVKIAMAHNAYKFFTKTSFDFSNVNYLQLQKKMSLADTETFFMDPKGLTKRDTVRICAAGIKKFLFNEKAERVTLRRAKYRKMYWLHIVTQVVLAVLIGWAILRKIITNHVSAS